MHVRLKFSITIAQLLLFKSYWEEQTCFEFLIWNRINFLFLIVCIKSELEKQRSHKVVTVMLIDFDLLRTLHRTLYVLHRTLYTVRFTPYIVHCKFYTVHRTLYVLHRTSNIVSFTLFTVRFRSNTVPTSYNVQCKKISKNNMNV